MDKRLQKVNPSALGLLTTKFGSESLDSVTYATFIRGYGDLKYLCQGQLVHAHITMGCFHGQTSFLENLLIQMYGKCGCLEDASSVFSKMVETDQFSWNLFIGACVQNNEYEKALFYCQRMQLQGFLANKHSYLHVLAASGSSKFIRTGKRIHAQILSNSVTSDVVLECAVVNMYGKCDSVLNARMVFEAMTERNVISWNAMISAYAQQGQIRDALEIFGRMLAENYDPTMVTFISLLDVCTNDGSPEEAMCMHFYVASCGYESDEVVGTALIDVYGKCGSLGDALNLFYNMKGRSLVTWNSMISVCALHSKNELAFQLFTEMSAMHLMPSRSTFVGMLSACTTPEDLDNGRYVHLFIEASGMVCDVILETALVTMYGKCGSLRDARIMFDSMSKHDVVSWTSIITACLQHGNGNEALSLLPKIPSGNLLPDNITFVSIFDACASEGALLEGRLMHTFLSMNNEFQSDVVLNTALINMYSKCGELEDAIAVFTATHGRDIVAWNAIIASYAQHGEVEIVMQLFLQMLQESVDADSISFICVLTACSHAGLVEEASQCLQFMECHGVSPEVDHYNCVLDLLGRSGWMIEAEKLVIGMSLQPSIGSWMTLLSTCRMHLDVLRGECAADHVFELQPEFSAPYVVLSNIYAITGHLDVAEKLNEILNGGNLHYLIE